MMEKPRPYNVKSLRLINTLHKNCLKRHLSYSFGWDIDDGHWVGILREDFELVEEFTSLELNDLLTTMIAAVPYEAPPSPPVEMYERKLVLPTMGPYPEPTPPFTYSVMPKPDIKNIDPRDFTISPKKDEQ